MLAAIILLLAESIGVWFLNTHMTIPAERIYAANWVFQASLVAFMFGLFSVPYHASIVAHERMTAFATSVYWILFCVYALYCLLHMHLSDLIVLLYIPYC